MPFTKTFYLMLSTILLLTGCDEKPMTIDYLMQHPTLLKKKIDDCQATNMQSNPQGQCEMVFAAAKKFLSILNEQQQDPEKFGEQVMTAERTLIQRKKDLNTAQVNYTAMHNQSQNSAEVNKAEENLKNAQTTYQAQREEVKTLLAVIGVNSPE